PTNGLDPAGIREIRQYIRRLATEENVAVIISSHLLSEIELMCDWIGVIKNGELIATQNVHGDTDDAEQQDLRQIQMEITPVEQAIDVLKSEHQIEAILTNGSISFQIEKNKVPNIIQTFVKQEIAIYQR